ncbi:MAG: PKD domain-containing protein [Bacteroidia bacterium]
MKWKILGIIWVMAFAANGQSLDISKSEVCAKSPIDFSIDLPKSISSYESVLLKFGDGKEVEITKQFDYKKHRYFYQNEGSFEPQLQVKEKGNSVKNFKGDRIKVLPIPSSNIINHTADSLCFGDTFQFKGPWQDQNKRKITNWSWSFGDGTKMNAQNVEKAYLKPGEYTVELESRIENGCWAKAVRKVKVFEPFEVNFKVLGTDQHEVGSTYTFKNKSEIDTSEVSRWIWYWDWSKSHSWNRWRNRADTFYKKDIEDHWESFDVEISNDGYSSPMLHVTHINGCMDSLVLKDEIRQLTFRFDITWVPDTPCFSKNEITFNMQLRPNATQLQWNFGDSIKGVRFNENKESWSPKHKFSYPGYYNVNFWVLEPPALPKDTTICFVKIKGPMAKIQRNEIKNSFVDIRPIDTAWLRKKQKNHFDRARKGIDSIPYWQIEKVNPFVVDSIPQYFNAPMKTSYAIENACGGDTILKPVYTLTPTSYQLIYQDYRVIDSGYVNFNESMPTTTIYHPAKGRKYKHNMHDSDLYHPAPFNLVNFTNNSIKYRTFGKKRNEKPLALRYAWDNVPGEFPDKARNPNYPWASDSIQYLWFFDDPTAKACTSTVANPNVRCAYSTEVAPKHMYNKMGVYSPILKVIDTVCNCVDFDTITINMQKLKLTNSKGNALNWNQQNAKIRRGEGDYGFRIEGYNCTNQYSDQKPDFGGLPFDENDIENYWMVLDADEQCDSIHYRYLVGGHFRDTILRTCDWISRDSLKTYRYGYNYKTGGWKTIGAIIKVGDYYDTLFIENYKWVNHPVPDVSINYEVESLSDSFLLKVRLNDESRFLDSTSKIEVILFENKPWRKSTWYTQAFRDSFNIQKEFKQDLEFKISSKSNFQLNVHPTQRPKDFKNANSCFDFYSEFINHDFKSIFNIDTPLVCINDSIEFLGGGFYWIKSAPHDYYHRFIGRDIRDSVYGRQWIKNRYPEWYFSDSSFFTKGFKAPKRIKWQQNPNYELPDYEEQIAWDFDEDLVFDAYGSKVNWKYARAGVYQPWMYLRDSTGFWQRYKTRSPITVYNTKPRITSNSDSILHCIDFNYHEFKGNNTNIKRYKWFVNGKLQDTSSTFNWLPTNAGGYEIGLRVIDEYNCELHAPPISYNILGPTASFKLENLKDTCNKREIVLLNQSQNAKELYWYLNGNQIGKTNANIDSFSFKLPYWGDFYLNQVASSSVYDSSKQEYKNCSDGFPEGGRVELEMPGAPNSAFTTHRDQGIGWLKFVPEDTMASQYIWIVNGLAIIKGAPGIIHSSFGIDYDSILVCLKVIDESCVSETCKTQWVNSNSIDHINSSIEIFPNPIKSQLYIQSESVINHIEVFNGLGQLILTDNCNSQNAAINTLGWQPSIYFLKLQIEGDSAILKVVKE